MNRSLKDDICDYWQVRAESYDASPGHGMGKGAQRSSWARLISAHLGERGEALDLGCGTGEVALVLRDIGLRVTGLDMTPAMLAHARAKAAGTVRFIQADAECTMEPDARYDAITARYLFWTLPDPQAALKDWHRILRPGGRLLIMDGDHVRTPPLAFLAPLLDRIFGRDRHDGHAGLSAEQWQAHRDIVARLPFRQGLRLKAMVAMLEQSGFQTIRIEKTPWAMRPKGWRQNLLRLGAHRFAISAQKLPA